MNKPSKQIDPRSAFAREIKPNIFVRLKNFFVSRNGFIVIILFLAILFVSAATYYSLNSNKPTDPTLQTAAPLSERDRIAKETKQLEDYAAELDKSEIPSKDDPQARFAYFNTLISSALASKNCQKAMNDIEAYGLDQNLQNFSNATLETIGSCYLVANNKAKARIVFVANLAKFTNAKKGGQVAANDISELNILIAKAQRLVDSTK